MSVAEQKTQMSVGEAMTTAWQHYGAQRFQLAERLARQVINAEPRHSDAASLLGVIAYKFGKLDDAIAWVERAVSTNPDAVALHSNLCEIYRQYGNLDRSIASGKRAIEIDPQYLQALNNLGIAYFEKGDMALAEELYRRALVVDPSFAEAHNNLANALRFQRKLDDAMLEYKAAIELKPAYPEALSNLGTTLRELGEFDEAEKALRMAIGARPTYVEAYNNLALTLWDRKQSEEALGILARSMAVEPDKPEAMILMAFFLLDLGRTQGALYACQRALRNKPDHAGALNLMGRICRDLEDLTGSIEYCRKAIALKPDSADLFNNLGISLLEVGDLEGASNALTKALEFDPESLPTHINLASAKKFKAGDPVITFLEAAVQKEDLKEEQRISVHYSLGKAYDDTKQYEKAFQQFLAGAKLKRTKLNYEEGQALRLFDRIQHVFTPKLIAERSGYGDPDARPLFILGMPRSGSTLVEQIVASHPEVLGAGEVKHLHQGVLEVDKMFGSAVRYPELMHLVEQSQLQGIAKYYREHLPKLPAGKTLITDKMLTNYYYVGLIHLLFPNARIIHCKRSPIDTCISSFSKMFREDMPYTYDLRETARFYKKYLQLMEYWKALLPPNFILEVTYEQVVADFENEARRIIAYCGLEWDPACLEFYKTERTVKTASVAQVRQPLYNSSVQRWKNYGEYINPLIDELGPLAQ